MLLGLRAEALDRPRRQFIQPHVIQIEFERALRLNLAGRQQVLDQHRQAIRLVFDHAGILAHDAAIPFHIVAPERRRVPFDQGDRRFQLVRDRRDEDVLHLLRLPKVGDVADVGDDVGEMSVRRQQRRVDDADAQGQAVAPQQIALDVERVGRVVGVAKGPALIQRLAQIAVFKPLPDDHLVLIQPDGVAARHAVIRSSA